MNVQTKKLLEYTAIGLGILILLLLYFSKKGAAGVQSSNVQPETFSPLSFAPSSPQNFSGISEPNLNNIKLTQPNFIGLNLSSNSNMPNFAWSFIDLMTFTPKFSNSLNLNAPTCGICNSSNKISKYAWS